VALNDLHEAKKTVNSMDQKLKGLNDEKAAQEAKLNELQKINMEKANRVQAMELEHKNVEEALRLKTEEYDSKMAELTKMEFEIETMESESKNIDLRSNGINYDFARETFNKYL
jgi:chromosome segregation ATPase